MSMPAVWRLRPKKQRVTTRARLSDPVSDISDAPGGQAISELLDDAVNHLLARDADVPTLSYREVAVSRPVPQDDLVALVWADEDRADGVVEIKFMKRLSRAEQN